MATDSEWAVIIAGTNSQVSKIIQESQRVRADKKILYLCGLKLHPAFNLIREIDPNWWSANICQLVESWLE